MRATLWILVLCLWGSSQAKRHFTINPKEATDLDHNKNASHFVIMPKVDVMDDAHFSIDLEEIEDLGPIESRAKLIMNPGDTATISSTGTSGYHRQVEVFKTNPENDIKIECIGSFEDPRNCRKFRFIFKDGVENIRKRVKCGDGVKVMHSSTTGFLKMIFKSRHLYAEFSFTCSVTCYAKMSTTTTTTVNGPNCNTFNGISCADNEIATCGVPSTSRIVGGTETTIESVPWQVALANQGSTHPYCGGTIVNSRFIVTAAHCVLGDNPSNVFVVVGETDIQTSSTRLAVESITIHEGYDENTLANDIAVIELVEPLTFSDTVKPACAPEANNDYVGDLATVSGWGTLYTDGPQPNILNKVDLNIISFDECQNDYNNALTAGMICAKDTGKDSCQGDSGGPLVNQAEGVYALVGVVSWGYGCARPEYPGVYTEVEHFLDWINDIISSGGLQCELML